MVRRSVELCRRELSGAVRARAVAELCDLRRVDSEYPVPTAFIVELDACVRTRGSRVGEA